MFELVGSSLTVFLLFTCVGMGWVALMTGRAIAATWRSPIQVLPYGVLLALVNRFLVYALFDGTLLSLGGLIICGAYLVFIGWLAYREHLAYKMVTQYPWLYTRKGPLNWQERNHTAAS